MTDFHARFMGVWMGVFRSFVDFSDQEIHYDYPRLNGRFVKVKVDRIDVSF